MRTTLLSLATVLAGCGSADLVGLWTVDELIIAGTTQEAPEGSMRVFFSGGGWQGDGDVELDVDADEPITGSQRRLTFDGFYRDGNTIRMELYGEASLCRVGSCDEVIRVSLDFDCQIGDLSATCAGTYCEQGFAFNPYQTEPYNPYYYNDYEQQDPRFQRECTRPDYWYGGYGGYTEYGYYGYEPEPRPAAEPDITAKIRFSRDEFNARKWWE